MEEPIKRVVIEEFEDRIEVNGEAWGKKWMEKTYTGHLYYGSAMETSSDCGNCDGGNCDSCELIWRVGHAMIPDRPWFYRVTFDTEEKAKAYFDSI